MNKGERWITIAGQHILLKEGETPMNAYIRHMAKKKQTDVSEKVKKEDNDSGDMHSEVKSNKFGVDDPFILFGEKHGTGSVTEEDMIKFYEKKAKRTGEDKWAINAERLAKEYVEYRRKIKK